MQTITPTCPRCGNNDRSRLRYRAGVFTCYRVETTPAELAALEAAGYDAVGGVCGTEFNDRNAEVR